MIGRKEFLKKLLEIMSEKAQATRRRITILDDYLKMLEKTEKTNVNDDLEAANIAFQITDSHDSTRIEYLKDLVEVGEPSFSELTMMAGKINTETTRFILTKDLDHYEKCVASIQILQSQGDKAKMMLFVQRYINLFEALVSCDKADVLGKGKLENQIQLIEESFAKEGYTIFGGMDAFKAIREEDAFTEEDYEAAFVLSWSWLNN